MTGVRRVLEVAHRLPVRDGEGLVVPFGELAAAGEFRERGQQLPLRGGAAGGPDDAVQRVHAGRGLLVRSGRTGTVPPRTRG